MGAEDDIKFPGYTYSFPFFLFMRSPPSVLSLPVFLSFSSFLKGGKGF